MIVSIRVFMCYLLEFEDSSLEEVGHRTCGIPDVVVFMLSSFIENTLMPFWIEVMFCSLCHFFQDMFSYSTVQSKLCIF